jgi:ubiquinone/menaquinone biosynthesis C-methylase UbiE
VLSVTESNLTPFDAIAQKYDSVFTNSLIGRAQRQAVWQRVRNVFQSGDKILEINCGTGVDAVYLARMGVEVLALDSSAGMVAVAQRRIQQESVGERVRVQQRSIEDLGSLENEGPFDGILSNFGGLNCVPNLQKVGQDLARLLKPGSSALFCLLGRWCCWEFLYYLTHLQPSKAFRRVRRGGTEAQLGNYRKLPAHPRQGVTGSALAPGPDDSLHVYYPSVPQLVAALAPHFRLRSHQAIGLVVPPSYVEPWVAKYPRLLKLAVGLDARISMWPVIRSLGDHYLAHLERL